VTFYIIELRLRIVARPHSNFALGNFAVVEIKNHFVVIVTTEVSTLRSDFQPVPRVLVGGDDALLQADQLPIGHAREREVIARASGGKQVEIFVINVAEDEASRTIEASAGGFEPELSSVKSAYSVGSVSIAIG